MRCSWASYCRAVVLALAPLTAIHALEPQDPARWGHIRIVGNAYANSGDPKYAEAMIRYLRSFYRTVARPPAQRPKTIFGAYGPWRSLNASGRVMGGYMPATYREIGAAPC